MLKTPLSILMLDLDLLPTGTLDRTSARDADEGDSVDVFLLKSAGGDLPTSAVDAVGNYLADVVSKSSRYVLVYDVTAPPRSFLGAVPHIIQMSFRVRPLLEKVPAAQKATVVVCADAMTRGVIELLVAAVPRVAPVYVVASLDEAWPRCRVTLEA